jgi:hypothetical protein
MGWLGHFINLYDASTFDGYKLTVFGIVGECGPFGGTHGIAFGKSRSHLNFYCFNRV